MEYYHNLITQKSWQELTNLRKLVDFVLIGGWAVYLFTKTLKSKDIDIIVDFDQLPFLGKNYLLSKNERLSKYEARKEEIEIDVYLPHFSQLGIPVEDLLKQKKEIEGFQVLDINFLFALKVFVLSQRGRTPKGRKDFLDLISLAASKKHDLSKINKIANEFSLRDAFRLFGEFLQETTQIQELNLNAHSFSRIKEELRKGLLS